MSEVKLFEVRDSMTCISAMGMKLSPANERERWLLGRAGFGVTPEQQSQYVFFGGLDPVDMTYDPFKQRSETMRIAHQHIRANWDTLEHGALVDVQFIRGETTSPVESDQHYSEGA